MDYLYLYLFKFISFSCYFKRLPIHIIYLFSDMVTNLIKLFLKKLKIYTTYISLGQYCDGVIMNFPVLYCTII